GSVAGWPLRAIPVRRRKAVRTTKTLLQRWFPLSWHLSCMVGLRIDVPHVLHQTQPIEQPDEVSGQIELPPVPGGLGQRGAGVMVVVPRPTHRGWREGTDVAAAVPHRECT